MITLQILIEKTLLRKELNLLRSSFKNYKISWMAKI